MRRKYSHLGLVAACTLVISWSGPASGEMIGLVLTVDEPVVQIDETTTLRVFAEVFEGQADNGIFAYALNILADVTDIVEMNSAIQLGDPDPDFSNSGTILADGLHEVVGMDGGFFTDKNRGIGGPFELLEIEVQGLAEGEVTFGGAVGDNADAKWGIADGFMLQQPGSVPVCFGATVGLTVVPEPGAATVALIGALGLVRRRVRR